MVVCFTVVPDGLLYAFNLGQSKHSRGISFPMWAEKKTRAALATCCIDNIG